jgi:hypothetical protein
MNSTILNCLSKVENALINHDLYESCFEGIMRIPMVVELKTENKRMADEIHILNLKIKDLEMINTKNSKIVDFPIKIKEEKSPLQ